jgi:hypothetical protein
VRTRRGLLLFYPARPFRLLDASFSGFSLVMENTECNAFFSPRPPIGTHPSFSPSPASDIATFHSVVLLLHLAVASQENQGGGITSILKPKACCRS